MSHHVEARQLVQQSTAAVIDQVPLTRLADWLEDAYHEILARLGDAGSTPAGPPYGRFDLHDGVVDAEARFPVSGPAPDIGQVEPSSLPGGTAAVTTHYGRYEDLPRSVRGGHAVAEGTLLRGSPAGLGDLLHRPAGRAGSGSLADRGRHAVPADVKNSGTGPVTNHESA